MQVFERLVQLGGGHAEPRGHLVEVARLDVGEDILADEPRRQRVLLALPLQLDEERVGLVVRGDARRFELEAEDLQHFIQEGPVLGLELEGAEEPGVGIVFRRARHSSIGTRPRTSKSRSSSGGGRKPWESRLCRSLIASSMIGRLMSSSRTCPSSCSYGEICGHRDHAGGLVGGELLVRPGRGRHRVEPGFGLLEVGLLAGRARGAGDDIGVADEARVGGLLVALQPRIHHDLLLQLLHRLQDRGLDQLQVHPHLRGQRLGQRHPLSHVQALSHAHGFPRRLSMHG